MKKLLFFGLISIILVAGCIYQYIPGEEGVAEGQLLQYRAAEGFTERNKLPWELEPGEGGGGGCFEETYYILTDSEEVLVCNDCDFPPDSTVSYVVETEKFRNMVYQLEPTRGRGKFYGRYFYRTFFILKDNYEEFEPKDWHIREVKRCFRIESVVPLE